MVMKNGRYGWMLIPGLAAAVVLTATQVRGATDQNNADRSSPSPPAQATPGSVQEQQRLSGTINALDPSAQTISVKGLVMSKTLSVGSDSQITIEGKPQASFSDLNVGDRVDVTYHASGKTFIADRIVRQPAKDKPQQ
jgi:hypothetical protein